MTVRRRRVLVVGARGFIGGAVFDVLIDQGHEVSTMRGPRLPSTPASAAESFIATSALIDDLREEFAGVDAVVNAAGNPDASETDGGALVSPNGILPGLLAAACQEAEPSPRLVHVSSAVVQGRAPVLDASRKTDGFSVYARSKILGETLVLQQAPDIAVVYRPPSVHAVDRRVTRMTARVARSPLSTIARPGSSPSPQALLANVASAVAFLATCPQQPPSVVAHPSEGLTTSGVMQALGGRRPRELPRWVARAAVSIANGGGRLSPAAAANARRMEMLWFGQAQACSWLTEAGWSPHQGEGAWTELGHAISRTQTVTSRGKDIR
jgi:dTDP-4-dehydrorhamnose reductase